MSEWLQFLSQHGACLSLETPRQVITFNGPNINSARDSDFFAPLTDLGLIAVTGDEAAHFLHNQLTNDVENLGSDDVRLAGYCTPKGRLLATLLCWRFGETIMLQLPRQIQTTIQKRLQMFVLRAKAKLRDASDEYVVLGLVGEAASTALEAWFPQSPASPYEKTESEAGTLIRLANADGLPRFQWITSSSIAIEAWPQLTGTLRTAGPSEWRLSEIHAGIPGVTQTTQEQFVPQMINFDLIGGVNFRKGCYPGQEIVARSQYLGKIKRRMLLATVESADATPGMDVFAAVDPGQPCGMIVNAEMCGVNQMDCLVEMKVTANDNGTVYLGAVDGAVLQFKPLPYASSDPAC